LRGGLDPFDGGDSATDVRTVFSWSYRALGPAAARLFRLLGLHPGPDFCAPAAAGLLGTPQIRPLLAELTRAHLLVEHQPGRYVLHDLLRAYAVEQAQVHDSVAERRLATRRLLDHYVRTSLAAARWLNPAREATTPAPPAFNDFAQALAWFTTEHRVLLAAAEHAAATGFDTHAWHLAQALAEFLERRGHWSDLAALGQVALAAALNLADPLAQSHAHRLLARADTQLDRLDDARFHLRCSLHTAGDPAGQARTQRELARLSERQGEHDQALRHCRQALYLYQAAGHRHGQAEALSAAGWYQALLGDLDRALSSCQAALTLLEELDDVDGQAATWDSLGHIRHHRGDHQDAIACYLRSLDLFRSLGDRYRIADVLVHLGDSHLAAGDPGRARRAWREALGIIEDLDHPDAGAVHARLRPMRTQSLSAATTGHCS
jgi:tetratricopeptide (TPR) repeat protein